MTRAALRAVALAALVAACRTVPLADPIPVSCAARPDVTPLAVRRALNRAGWEILEETPVRTRAQLRRRGWTMVVDVTWEKDFQIRYVSSQSLGFDRRHGTRYIHHGYNERAQRLAESIATQTRIVLADVDPDALLGPPVGAPPPAQPAR